MLTILQHTSPNYAPRTRLNALAADVTVTFACDQTTRGEKLTHKSAGKKHIGFSLTDVGDVQSIAVDLANFMEHHNCSCLNIAGNGLSTLSKHGWPQARVDNFVTDVLRRVLRIYNRDLLIVTGGQTGVDLAGARAAVYCGVAATITLPYGYVQRGADGVDRTYSHSDIEKQITEGAENIELDDLTDNFSNLLVDL